MKKLIALIAPIVLILSACATGTAENGMAASSTTHQLGSVALKIAINAKCTTELNNLAAWQTATKLMSIDQKNNIQTEICDCVSEKAPRSVTTADLATAAIDPTTRTIIVSNIVTKTINACVAEAVK